MDSNKNGFTAKDLCDIIKTCSETGLAELKFGELQLSFVKKAEVVKEQKNLTPPVEEITETQHTEQTQEALADEEAKVKHDRLNQMFLEDPLQAENLLQDEELENDDDESDESE